jgi:hypothetical protein
VWIFVRLLVSLALAVPLAFVVGEWLPFRTPGELLAAVVYPSQPCCDGWLPHFGQRFGLALSVDVALCFGVLCLALGLIAKWWSRRTESA